MGCACCAVETPGKEEEGVSVERAPLGEAKGVTELTVTGKEGTPFLDVSVRKEALSPGGAPSEVETTTETARTVATTEGLPAETVIVERPPAAKPFPEKAPVEEPEAGVPESAAEKPVEKEKPPPEVEAAPEALPSPVRAAREEIPPAPEVAGTDGAYLLYTTANDGLLYSLWKKEADPEALAFCKPAEGVRVPPFKYRSRAELVRGLHRSRKGLCEGILQYFRTVKAFRCLAQYNGLAPLGDRVPPVSIVLHYPTNRVDVVRAGRSFDMTAINGIAVVISDTVAERELHGMTETAVPISLDAFQARCKANAENCEYLILSGV